MSSLEGQQLHSGLLDILVEHIARTVASSAVFVTAEVPQTGVRLLAEYPRASATIAPVAQPYEQRADGGRWMDEPAVAAPVQLGDAVIGWAVMVGPTVAHEKSAEGLMTLLAKCASVLLSRPYRDESVERAKRRWEDAARDGYWEWDLASGAMRFSRQSLSLLDHRERDRPSRASVWLDRVHPDDRATLITSLLTATTDHTPAESEHRIVRRDGSVGWLAVRALLERDGSGRPMRLIGWLSDVSRARHVEAELRKAQSLADVGRVAAGTAHDFNNFLTVIRGHTELALWSVDPASDARESLELIKHAAAGATALTRQLLTLRRRHAVAPQSLVDLNVVVAATERTLRSLAGSSTRVNMNYAAELPAVRVEPTQVERLLINLVVNARDAMPSGGVVTIETADAPYDTLGADTRPLLLPVGDYVVLTVNDTGAGMNDETRARIFDPFFTTKPIGQGTGLGLWIARDIMQRCGGGIDVRSTPGSGTTFTMYFPRAEPLA